jgi:hypothetical protein
VIVAAWVALSVVSGLRAPRQDELPPPPDSACADRPYTWARSDTDRTAAPEDGAFAANADFGDDRVRLTNYSFRPGEPSQVVSSGLIWNETGSTIEIRGYHVEYLSSDGDVVGESHCRVSMGGEQCGVGGTNLKRAGGIALIADTLVGAPDTADPDTARIYWSYCLFPDPAS